MTQKQALMIATVAQSLVFQAPAMRPVLADRGFIVTNAAGSDMWSASLAAEGNFEPLPLSRRIRPRELGVARSRIGELLRRPWHLVQLQSPIAAALARTVPDLQRVPSLYVVHGYHFHHDGRSLTNALYGSLEFALAGRTAGIAVVAKEDFESAMRLGLHKRAVLWRLPGAGVDLAAFQAQGTKVDSVPNLIFCGELNSNKDPGTAIMAVERARIITGRDLRLTVVGSGPLQRLVEIAASEKPWLRYFPHVPQRQMPEILASATTLIAPSHREGLPRVIIEAIASGLSVVARSNRGSRELCSGLAKGWLVDSDDLDVWAKAVIQADEAGPLSALERQSVAKYDSRHFQQSYSLLIEKLTTRNLAPGAFDMDAQE